MQDISLRVIDIIPGTSVDGPGLRTSIYFAGCTHHCPGCHNPQSWNREAGRLMTVKEIMDVISENGFNVTFSGGDPLQQDHKALTALAKEIHRSGHTIWCYTGYRYEDIVNHPDMTAILNEIDVLVDGQFMQDRRDTSLHFRGSANQRIIDLRASTPGHIMTFME